MQPRMRAVGYIAPLRCGAMNCSTSLFLGNFSTLFKVSQRDSFKKSLTESERSDLF